MKLKKVDPGTIKVPEVRVTAQFDDELLTQFKDSLDAIGQIAPIIVYQVGEELVLCDGLHRLDEAKPLMRRALEIFENSLGSDHPSTATVRKNLASLLSQ